VVDPGENITVTFTNTKRGSLEVIKSVVKGDYAFPNNFDATFTVKVIGPSYPGPGGITHDFVVDDGVLSGSPWILTNLLPGVYTVTETDPGVAWTVSGGGAVTIDPGEPESTTITNTIKLPHTTASLTANVYETSPGGNVWLYISDTNDGAVPLTDPHIHLFLGATEFDANGGVPGIQPLTKGDAYWSVGPPTWAISSGTPNGDTNNNGIMDVGETWHWAVQVTLFSDTLITINGHGTDPLGNPVDGPTYPTETKSITVEVNEATRTQGFWATHFNFTKFIFEEYAGSYIDLGWLDPPITTMEQLMGVFWANNANNSDGTKRDALCQTKIIASQQALAAILNSYMPGGAPLPAGYGLADIITILSGGDINAIRMLNSVLGAFNEGGDDVALDPGLPPTGPATPQISKEEADTTYANCPGWVPAAITPPTKGPKK